jgi:AcrR family transcriptional regulator
MKENKIMTIYMESLRERILETAMSAFAKEGVKAVKMDDIARRLSISKRTLYEIYENKESLLCEGLKKYKTEKEREQTEIYKNSKNVMDTILYVYRQKVVEFKKTCPEFYAEIVKYPSVVKLFQEDRQLSHERMMIFLKRGVDEGYFRSDVNLELASKMFDAISVYIMKNQLYKQFTIEQLFHDFVFVSLRGFCTPEGVRILDENLNSEPDTAL